GVPRGAGARWPRRAGEARRAHRRGVRRARVHRWIGLDGVQGARHGRERDAAEGTRGIAAARRADLHPCHEGRDRPRREHLARAAVVPGRERAREAARGDDARAVSQGARVRAGPWADPRRHEVRIRLLRREAHAHRRGAHAGLVAVLGRGLVQTGWLAADETAARDAVRVMGTELLANPVIEDYAYELKEGAPA